MLLDITDKIIRENAFELETKETRDIFNAGLSADWPSNNFFLQK